MTSLQIRELPPEVAAALKLRAERENRSLSQQALVELRRISEVGRRERRLEILARIAADPVRSLTVDPEDSVRADRDR